ncbi:8-oxo-dGTP diphosphatase [Vibrio crassostreae]|nr:8-oxo-dGTP diphosphatase [Vibrio crassostreae]CAK4027784.1 8-oxo-dGTP diphosphatase [Vibrio crassostreae]
MENELVLMGLILGQRRADTLNGGESIEECAKRETLEETGLVVSAFEKLSFTNDIFEKENKHYITLFVVTSDASGEPDVTEPDKCKQWKWFKLDELPEPLFLPLTNLLSDQVILGKLAQ